jgi:hypothetical protein
VSKVTEENEALYRKAAFGKIIEDFQSSDIGIYLIRRAESEAEQAIEKLKTCDPKDGKVVQSLQNEVWKAESFQKWLADAILDGLQAHNMIDNEE